MSICQELRLAGVVIWAEGGQVKARGADAEAVAMIRANKAQVLDEIASEAKRMPDIVRSLEQARQIALSIAETKPHVRGNCLALIGIFDLIFASRNDFAEFHYLIARYRSRAMELVSEIRCEENARVYEGSGLVTLAREVLLANTTFRITDEALA